MGYFKVYFAINVSHNSTVIREQTLYDFDTFKLVKFLHLGLCSHPWRRKRQPTPVFLPGERRGWRSLAVQSVGSQRAGHDWATGHALARAGRLGRRVVVGVKCRLGLLGLNPQRLSH